MRLSLQALVLAALSLENVLAQPPHRHLHHHKRDLAETLHEKRIYYDTSHVDWAEKDWKMICAGGKCLPGGVNNGAAVAAGHPDAAVSAAPVNQAENVATPAQSSAPATSASASSQSASSDSTGASDSSTSTGSCSDLSSVWTTGDTSRNGAVYMGDGSACPGGCTSASSPKLTKLGGMSEPRNVGQTDGYIGNVGVPYGSNMLPLSDCDTSGYDYSITFTNKDSSPIKVAMWNKVGDDNATPGRVQTGASRNAWYTFPLEAGQSAAFAIAENSQIAFSQACGRDSTNGLFDCTWGEADFCDLNVPNTKWSGYDRSSLPNGAGNTGLLTVCADGFDCSSQAKFSFTSHLQGNTGGRTNIPAGQPAHIKVAMG